MLNWVTQGGAHLAYVPSSSPLAPHTGHGPLPILIDGSIEHNGTDGVHFLKVMRRKI